MSPAIVVDTNILFAALVSCRSHIRELLFTEKDWTFSALDFYWWNCSNTRNASRPPLNAAATELPEEDLLDALNALLARVNFVDEATIPIGTWLEARRLCHDIDEKDTPFLALTIHLNARLWTDDSELKTGTVIRIGLLNS